MFLFTSKKTTSFWVVATSNTFSIFTPNFGEAEPILSIPMFQMGWWILAKLS